jgi:putative two-component system response regulator
MLKQAIGVVSGELREARILIVDDQETNLRLLSQILKQAGYRHLERTTNPRQALPLFDQFQPDLLLTDLQMPEMDGFEVIEAIRERVPEGVFLPIMMLTADLTPETRLKALSVGAHDFLNKPFDVTEVWLRIKNLLQARMLYLQVQRHNDVLEERVRERTHQLEEAYGETLERLARAAEYRDDNTGQHTQRVGRLSALVAEALDQPADQVALIQRAALLHDVGKIGVPDRILLKPGKLTPEEFQEMKMHAVFGARLLERSAAPLLQLAEEIAFCHHERWDGTGYWGLSGEQIPLAARIVSVIDVFDALTHERPYKPAWPVEEALAELKRQSGKQFDPVVLDAFLRVIEAHPEILGTEETAPTEAEAETGAGSAPVEATVVYRCARDLVETGA